MGVIIKTENSVGEDVESMESSHLGVNADWFGPCGNSSVAQKVAHCIFV